MTYREQPTAVPGVVLWQRTTQGRTRILPDGCLDLVWDGREVFVAGPDTAARWHDCAPGSGYVALRFHFGIGPAVLRVPADELRDRSVRLDELLPARLAGHLADQMADHPVEVLTEWLMRRVAGQAVDPLGQRVHAMANAATPVAHMADRLGMSARQLHRRCVPIFGYGPRRLARILRLRRALDIARAGVPLADVAARCGYADQAHLCRDALALGGATPAQLRGERREEVDRVAVGVVDDGISHSPEGVPGF
ncbi:MAG TPA: helix-turn-helix domain-containing protein [Jatrophihabitantaceae bacterium]